MGHAGCTRQGPGVPGVSGCEVESTCPARHSTKILLLTSKRSPPLGSVWYKRPLPTPTRDPSLPLPPAQGQEMVLRPILSSWDGMYLGMTLRVGALDKPKRNQTN